MTIIWVEWVLADYPVRVDVMIGIGGYGCLLICQKIDVSSLYAVYPYFVE